MITKLHKNLVHMVGLHVRCRSFNSPPDRSYLVTASTAPKLHLARQWLLLSDKPCMQEGYATSCPVETKTNYKINSISTYDSILWNHSRNQGPTAEERVASGLLSAALQYFTARPCQIICWAPVLDFRGEHWV